MATARRRDEWDRTAAVMSWLSCIWSKRAKFEPDRLNPVRQAEAKAGLAALTPEQMKARRREQVRTVGRMLAEAKRKPKAEGG